MMLAGPDVRFPVARRLMMRLAMIGCVFAVLVSIGELAIEYRRDHNRLIARLDQIEQGYLGAVVELTWLEDEERLALLALGIERQPNVHRVVVVNTSGRVLAKAGADDDGDGPVRVYPLAREYHGQWLTIGELRVATSLTELRTRLWERSLTTFLANALLILVAAVLVHLMVHRVVTQPLGRLAAYARALGRADINSPPPDIEHASHSQDEFSDLVHAFDDMRRAIAESYTELRDSEGRYRDLFTNSPVSLWEEDFSAVKRALDALRPTVTDLSAHLAAHPHLIEEMAGLVVVLDVNEATLGLHRASTSRDLLSSLAQTFTPSSYRTFQRELLAIWHDEYSLVMDGEIQTLDGEPREVVVRWNVPPQHRDSLARVIISLEDVTDRKAAERSLTITVEKLMQANSELERFTFVAAHHLQEPVRTVVSFGQLLERHLGQALDDETRDYVGYLTMAARRMQEQVRGLLEYSRAGQASGNFAPVDLGAALAAARETLTSAIAESRAVITVAPLPTVPGDFSLLSLVLRHLVGNAIKFHRPGIPPRIDITAERQETVWQLTVADNGIGFDPAFAANLFQVFGRLHGPAVYPGVGIGLAICRRIVEMHGGRIWSSAVAGEGARFHFTLPAG